MKYIASAKITLADLPSTKGELVENMLDNILDNAIRSSQNKNGLLTSAKSKVGITTSNENDILDINCILNAREELYHESTERLVRRIMSDSLNLLCEDCLESIVFDIVTLNVGKE